MNQESRDLETKSITLHNNLSVYSISKRVFDIIGACIGFILFFICFLVLVIPYSFGENKGSVIFSQTRIGKNGREFKILKFRTMKVNADEILRSNPQLYQKYIKNGYKLEPNEDPRITKLGKWLRKLSVDELPQFINVLKGDMSLVGPRPIVLEELKEYRKVKKENIFLSMKPGITGIWQTSGRSNINYPDRCDIELLYFDKKSLLFDFVIIFKTIWKVFKREGAF